MVVTQKTFNDLTLATLYLAKFATLQHKAYYIKVTANDGTNATVQIYNDSAATDLYDTRIYPVTASIFLVDLTQ